MDRKELIEDIVQEIFKRFTKELNELPKGMPLMVIGSLSKEDEENLQGCTLIPFTEDVSKYEKVIISEITTSCMARLALGYADTPKEQAILDALLKGKQVYVLEKGLLYRDYKHSAPVRLYALYHGYESTLRQFGMRIIKSTKECMDLQSKYTPPILEATLASNIQEPNTNKTHVFSKKLLLEKDLISARVGFNDRIELAKNCKITPLAEDFIRAHHLTIFKI